MIQTVAFTSYLNTEKHKHTMHAVNKIYSEVGEKMGFQSLKLEMKPEPLEARKKGSLL